MRISLAQVGKWIVELGEVPCEALRNVPTNSTPEELLHWSTVSETPSGRLRHLSARRATVGDAHTSGTTVRAARLSSPKVASAHGFMISAVLLAST